MEEAQDMAQTLFKFAEIFLKDFDATRSMGQKQAPIFGLSGAL
jgi:hypothetical protein